MGAQKIQESEPSLFFQERPQRRYSKRGISKDCLQAGSARYATKEYDRRGIPICGLEKPGPISKTDLKPEAQFVFGFGGRTRGGDPFTIERPGQGLAVGNGFVFEAVKVSSPCTNR